MTLVERVLKEVRDWDRFVPLDIVVKDNVKDVCKMIDEGVFEIKVRTDKGLETDPQEPPTKEEVDQGTLFAGKVIAGELITDKGLCLKAFMEGFDANPQDSKQRKEWKLVYEPILEELQEEHNLVSNARKWFLVDND